MNIKILWFKSKTLKMFICTMWSIVSMFLRNKEESNKEGTNTSNAENNNLKEIEYLGVSVLLKAGREVDILYWFNLLRLEEFQTIQSIQYKIIICSYIISQNTTKC